MYISEGRGESVHRLTALRVYASVPSLSFPLRFHEPDLTIDSPFAFVLSLAHSPILRSRRTPIR